jgi:hypothetical protein
VLGTDGRPGRPRDSESTRHRRKGREAGPGGRAAALGGAAQAVTPPVLGPPSGIPRRMAVHP